jgi:hypothetical protein
MQYLAVSAGAHQGVDAPCPEAQIAGVLLVPMFAGEHNRLMSCDHCRHFERM